MRFTPLWEQGSARRPKRLKKILSWMLISFVWRQ